MTMIVAAMAEELALLRARLVGATPITIPDGKAREVVSGRLGGCPVVLAVTGDGARNAREGIAAVLGAVSARELLVLGISGGLSPDLREGDVVVAARVVDEAAPPGAAVTAAASSIEAVARASGARPGTVVTARHIADSVAEKRRLFGLGGAATAVVDLETAGYVAAATAAGVPWMVLRAVSDTAGEALPGLLNRARDDGGAVQRSRVVRGLLGDPGALPALLTLRRRLKVCAEALARAATAVVTSGALPAPAPLSDFATQVAGEPTSSDDANPPLSPGVHP